MPIVLVDRMVERMVRTMKLNTIQENEKEDEDEGGWQGCLPRMECDDREDNDIVLMQE